MAPTSEEAQKGARLFLDKTCMNCHAIRGTPAGGIAGPDLTHLGSRQTLGAGVMDNTPANLKFWLADPQRFKPGCYMPNLHLDSGEVDDLAAYLEGLK